VSCDLSKSNPECVVYHLLKILFLGFTWGS